MVSHAVWKTWPSGLSYDKNLGLRPRFLSTESLGPCFSHSMGSNPTAPPPTTHTPIPSLSFGNGGNNNLKGIYSWLKYSLYQSQKCSWKTYDSIPRHFSQSPCTDFSICYIQWFYISRSFLQQIYIYLPSRSAPPHMACHGYTQHSHINSLTPARF